MEKFNIESFTNESTKHFYSDFPNIQELPNTRKSKKGFDKLKKNTDRNSAAK